jgi:hypothetical protein
VIPLYVPPQTPFALTVSTPLLFSKTLGTSIEGDVDVNQLAHLQVGTHSQRNGNVRIKRFSGILQYINDCLRG